MRLYISLLNASWPMPRMLYAPNSAPRYVKLHALAVIVQVVVVVGGMVKAATERRTRTCKHPFARCISVLLILG
jgi:hypothetical protein